ncbi:hypothetical protein SEA_VANLEE_83 [Gordonia phage VanLee]|uniref:Uncharacterized protein n=1 Tax=Gordonia phage VanLee TaxID=2845816 RepID=A0A8F2D9G1_9CAUD|nr:hypothetical protein QEH49_gp083 [Gordonia phage VanLee]QWS68200.1 hypothetical protein SEA_VANLEE_83 [Gordonia phage VanLee]
MSDTEEREAHRVAELAAGRCPDSGLSMERLTNVWGEDVFMCDVCDCFGHMAVEVDHHRKESCGES